MSSLLERYIAGEYEEVWSELTAGIDREGQEIPEREAIAVASETMARVRNNIELIVERLRSINYDFERYPDGTARNGVPYPDLPPPSPIVPFTPPPSDIVQEIQRLEALVGQLPLSLKAFWNTVGSVDLIGKFPDWEPHECLDPLVIFPIEEAFCAYDNWLEQRDMYGEESVGAFLIPLAPDDLHKDNVSGSGPYGITVPCSRKYDAPFEQDWHETTFANYLRICFQAGGFPGNSRYERWDIVEFLTEGLQPI